MAVSINLRYLRIMRPFTKTLAAGLVAVSLFAPLSAAAQATSTQARIQEIISQISALQMELKTLMASSSSNLGMPKIPPGQVGKMACISLMRNLGIGATGDDVRKVQEMLSMDPELNFTAGATGFFGPLTAQAMARFQRKHSIASSTDGMVGPLTRGFFQRSCGLGLLNSGPSANSGPGSQNSSKGKVENQQRSGTFTGLVTEKSGDDITVKQRINSGKTVSRLVHVTASTTIQVMTASSTAQTGTLSDITVNKTVDVTGMVNTDSSVTAEKIKVHFSL
jgi:peptidoglycan hydrolase-like protein with peptidoglycan-binding domain